MKRISDIGSILTRYLKKAADNRGAHPNGAHLFRCLICHHHTRGDRNNYMGSMGLTPGTKPTCHLTWINVWPPIMFCKVCGAIHSSAVRRMKTNSVTKAGKNKQRKGEEKLQPCCKTNSVEIKSMEELKKHVVILLPSFRLAIYDNANVPPLRRISATRVDKNVSDINKTIN